MPSVLELLQGRAIFLTGATGFVGKVLLEKLLRCVPGLRRIYVLVRPSKGCSASQRVQNEIVSSPVFTRLRYQIGEESFQKLVQEKIVAASGDLAQQNLGLSAEMLQDIKANVNIIIHSAASVDFNLRLDLAVEQNVYGTMRVLDVADACHELIAFLHISTAYTNCTQPSGAIVSERLYPCPFDIQAMLSTISRFSSRELQKVTVDGLIGDWPNTYTFTKFITEHLIYERCFASSNRYAVAIIRPTMIGAAWLEPVPGWVDVISAAGAIYVAGALGVLRILPGNPDHIGDIVPVDFVINAIILSIPAALNHPNRFFICQAAVSICKPWRWRQAIETLPPFFRTHLSEHAVSQNLSFKMVSSQTMYELEFLARYGIPSAVLNALAFIGTKSQKRNAEQFQRLVMKMSFIVNAFRYFTENEWRFESKNLFSTLDGLPRNETEVFWLDLTDLDYNHYHRTFAYGLLKYVLKEDLIEVADPRSSRQISLHEHINDIGSKSRLLPDISWAISRMKQQQQHSISGPNISQMKTAVLNSPRVQRALIGVTEREPDVSPGTASAHASRLLDIMIGETRPSVLITMAALLKKLFHRLYEDIFINLQGVERARHVAAKDDIPLIYVPTHRSYMDFLLISYICFIHQLPIPYIAAGDDFLELAVVRWLFRHSGAFFIRRSFHGDDLYKVLFSEYVRQLLCLGKSLEFFIEGSRSRSGKMVHPKLGLLRMVTNTVMNGDIRDAYIIPISINYEKTLEGSSYSKELQGNSKMKETLRNLIGASSSVLSSKFGRVSVHLGDPISIRAQLGQEQDLSLITKSIGYQVSWELQNASEIMPTHMLATLLLMYRRGISEAQLALKFEFLRREVCLRNGRLCFFESEKHVWLVRRSIELLRDLIEERHHNVFEPKISQRSDYPNMLLLGHYRNKIVHVFFREAIWACAFHSIGLDSSEGVDCGLLLTSATFLFSLIRREVFTSPDPISAEDFGSSFDLMVSRGVFRLLSNGRVEIASEAMFSFLCALCWPFIDSYYVTGLLLHTLEGNHEEEQVILRTQWLATTLYHESMICFYESCSGDTLRNALAAFHEQFGIITRDKKQIVREKRKKKGSLETFQSPRHRIEISINPKFQDGVELQQLIHRIDLLRKRPPVVRTSLRRAMIAEIPLLAKL